MGKPLGFKDFKRETPKKIDANARIANWKEIYLKWPESEIRDQGARCMDCGVPFCHTGCPLGNIIPEFNDQFKSILSPLLMSVPAQLLAYHVAKERGTDVDQPRNLAKSVTVE